jgi:preprotein translocase subunit SecE
MEYFRSATLLVAPMSFLSSVLADLPKIISPSLFPYMTTIVVLILVISLFVILLVHVDISSLCPLSDWSALATE